MKKLLLLLLLVGFSAVGADKPKTEFDKDGNILVRINGADKPLKPLTGIEKENFELLSKGPLWSQTGLEGIDDFGIRVEVRDYKHMYKDFDQKAVANQVELRLRQAKLDYNDKGRNTIIINPFPVTMSGRLVGYSVDIAAVRDVSFIAKSVEYKMRAVVWDNGGTCDTQSLRSHIDKIMDDLLLDYLKANPKKD